MEIATISCTSRGKRCTAIAKDKKKWVYDAISESEAEMMVDAILDRGYILTDWWRKL